MASNTSVILQVLQSLKRQQGERMRNSSVFILRSGQACPAAALVALVLTLFLTAAVEAQTPILKFDDPTSPGGTVSWAGPGSGIVGTNIQF
jgi:hypothetical protein